MILDATYPTPGYRKEAADTARDMGIPFFILHSSAPRAELEQRLARRQSQGSDISDATAAILDEQMRHFQPPAQAEGRLLACDATTDIPALLKELTG